MTDTDRATTPRWPGNPAELTAEGVDFEAIAHVLGNTCCWGGRSTRFYSLAQHAVTVSAAAGRLGGMNEKDTRALCLHALLADAWRAWPGAETGKAAGKNQREQAAVHGTVLEAAGLNPELPGEWADALRLVRRMAEATVARDLADAGIELRAEGPLFPPHRERVRPLAPDRAAKRWLERFWALSRGDAG